MKLKHLSIIIFCLVILFSCKKKDTITQETDNLFKYRDYISYTSSGLQSVAEPIKINLANAIEGWEQGQELKGELVSLSPHTDGKLVVLNTHTIIFTPDEHLDPATEYKVKVKLDQIYKNMPKNYEDYVFQFKTITPNFSINTNALQSYSKQWQYLEAVIKSADIISIEAAKTLVEASQNGKKLKLEFDEINVSAKQFEFRIDSINRLADDSEILITWNGTSIKAENKGKNTIQIPGINNFKIINVEPYKTPEQF
jgi:hypothetical protein